MREKVFGVGIVILLFATLFSGCIINEGPRVISFKVEPSVIQEGETADLSWTVSGATTVYIDNNIGNVSLSGNKTISPHATTTYTLIAYKDDRYVTAKVQIVVLPNEDISTLSFTMDNETKALMVDSVKPDSILWSDIHISGNCNTSNLGMYVTVGDKITECYGTIVLTYVPTGAIIGTFKFPEFPSVAFSSIYSSHTIVVISASPNLRWEDLNIEGVCDTSLLGTYVRAGDTITNCSGTITISYNGVVLFSVDMP